MRELQIQNDRDDRIRRDEAYRSERKDAYEELLTFAFSISQQIRRLTDIVAVAEAKRQFEVIDQAIQAKHAAITGRVAMYSTDSATLAMAYLLDALNALNLVSFVPQTDHGFRIGSFLDHAALTLSQEFASDLKLDVDLEDLEIARAEIERGREEILEQLDPFRVSNLNAEGAGPK